MRDDIAAIPVMEAAGWTTGKTGMGCLLFTKGDMSVWHLSKVKKFGENDYRLVYYWHYQDDEMRKYPAWTGKSVREITIEEASKL